MDADLGTRIKTFRKDQGWSQEELGRKAGISKTYLSELENGVSQRPSGSVLLKLADALGVTIADLMGQKIGPPEADGKSAIPASLAKFARDNSIPEADMRMLSSLRFRGSAPKTPERWRYIYEAIKMSESMDASAAD